jgi:hypothetical protein
MNKGSIVQRQASIRKGYLLGLAAAARKAEEWAAECCGGSGLGGEGYKNLAQAILKIDPDKGY